VILLPVISITVPVTWYVFAPAASVAPLKARLAAANKLIALLVFMHQLQAEQSVAQELRRCRLRGARAFSM